jgi:hypothetical protein
MSTHEPINFRAIYERDGYQWELYFHAENSELAREHAAHCAESGYKLVAGTVRRLSVSEKEAGKRAGEFMYFGSARK